MEWTISAFAVVVLGGAVVAIGVAVEALRQRPDPMAWPLAALMVGVGLWAIPHAIGLGYADVERVTFWQQLRYPGTVAVPVAYLVVALTFAGYDRWLSDRVYAILSIVPVSTLAIVWTNPFHGLFWESRSIATTDGASVFLPEFGPWFWIHVGYSYLLVLAGLAVLGVVVVRSGPLYRKQATLIFFGGLVPLAVNAAANFDIVTSPAVDLTTTAFAISGLLFVLALFHLDMIEVRPVARNLLLEELDDGVVVVGPRGRIRDFNRTASRILGDLDVDRSAETVLGEAGIPDGGELVAEIDGDERRFHARSTPLTDERGREIGRIVYLADVTEIAEREQRISVLNRILRHNIRNEMNVAAGHIDLLAERIPDDDREHVERASERIDRVVEFAEKARRVEQTIRSSDDVVPVAPVAVARRVVADARSQFPDADVELRVSDEAASVPDVRVVDRDLFERAVAELLENAVVHTDRTPRVVVRLETESDRVQLHVVDNGPGIPDSEAAVPASRTETQLDHGSGLGLWLVRWTASLSSATLSFAENEPRGTVVTLSLRTAEE